MFVTAFSHFCHLLGMSRIKLLYSAFEAESFWVVAVSFVFSQECADYAVEFCVFAKQVLAVEFRNGNAPNTNQLNTTSRGKLLNRRRELIKEISVVWLLLVPLNPVLSLLFFAPVSFPLGLHGKTFLAGHIHFAVTRYIHVECCVVDFAFI